ncbi:MAG: hypothetical protein K6E29_02595 [Cyanobacteria bacterium RUI128]|nr:hypothetical protein [Cyanobacteria bacterium RUI128]
MDFRLFFKNNFLKKPFSYFANSLDDADYTRFKDTLKKNSSWYVPNSVFNSHDKIIHKLFDSIDGTVLSNSGENIYGEKNNRLEKQELYDWVKYNYKQFKGKDISTEELENMSMSEFMNNVEDFLNNGYELK